MFRSLEDIYKEKEEKEKIAQLPFIRKLKYLAMAAILVALCLILINIIWIDTLSLTAMLVIRGFAGLFAILFVLIIALYMYKINASYHKQRYKFNKEDTKIKEDNKN